MIIFFPEHRYITLRENITYRQAEITPGSPVLEPEFHWEKPRVNLYGSVFKSNNGYEMYYQCGNAVRIGYAVSEDGIHWHKPLMNRTDLSAHVHEIVLANDGIEPINLPDINSDTGSGSNIKLTNLVAGYHMPSVIYEPDTDKPYKIFSFGEEGYRTLFSYDGKQFQEYDNNPVIPLMTHKNPVTDKNWCSDVAPCFKHGDGYVAMVKTYGLDKEQRTRRCIGISRSNDFIHWSEAKTIWEPGDREDRIALGRGFEWADFYGLCPFSYGSGYLGFLWLFEIEKELPTGTNQGKIEVFLVYSKDGESWHYFTDEPFIPWDLNFGQNGGMVTTPGAPIFDNDNIKIYYSDNNYEHGLFERDFKKEYAAPTWVIRCAQIKKERLVGAYSNSGKIDISVRNEAISRVRLNVECEAGELMIDFKCGSEILYTSRINNIDETDYWIDLPHRITCTDISITLGHAQLFAVEIQ